MGNYEVYEEYEVYEVYEVYKREEKRRAWAGASTCLITSLDIVLLPRSFGCG